MAGGLLRRLRADQEGGQYRRRDAGHVHPVDEADTRAGQQQPGRGRASHLADLEQRLSAIKEIPALLIFGDLDGTIKMGWLARLERIFPWHRTVIMKGSHHFPQVYDSAEVADAIHSFWDEVVTAS